MARGRTSTRASDSKLEAEILSEILAYLAGRTDLRAWRVNVVGARDRFGRVVHSGPKGQADISGILLGTGRRLEVEVKAALGRQTTDQKAWEDVITKYGGLYILARSVAEVDDRLAREHLTP